MNLKFPGLSAFTSPRSALRRLTSAVRALALAAFLLLFTAAFGGWSFDTGSGLEETRDLLAGPEAPPAPAGSWLRIQDLSRSMVHDADGREVEPWPGANPKASLEVRRAALRDLREHGYRLVAMVRWPATSWASGVRAGQPWRRLPLDLREASERCRQLAVTYGDLIDYWEIENEPDISYVEENPETYAAFLKACYLGFAEGAGSGKREAVGVGSEPLPLTSFPLPQTGRVLMAAFALPPGPYFDAWVANDGLRYTDGFNYHYYGYAEDFTGVYRQFEAAVANAPRPTPTDVAIFQTRFFPSNAGWHAKESAGFAFARPESETNRARLLARALATGEPALVEDGRWLVSPGTTVRETDAGWEFSVESPALEPERPAMAELPLPAGWRAGENTSLAFQYRAAGAIFAKREEESGKRPEPAEPVACRASSIISYPPLAPLLPAASRLPATSGRKLPIFLTEYGYGLLEREAALTPEGRGRQRDWFDSTQAQAQALGIEGPLAFFLKPYVEVGNQFGLLMNGESGKGKVASEPEPGAGHQGLANRFPEFGDYASSPALRTLLARGAEAAGHAAHDWRVETASPSPVVIDFVAEEKLTMAKTRQGYLLEANEGSGRLVVYNFSLEETRGQLVLEGLGWAFPDGSRVRNLILAPQGRRELRVEIRTADATRFGPEIAAARFVRGREIRQSPEPASAEDEAIAIPRGPITVQASPVSRATPEPETFPFEVYIRTANGNLYQTWPRLRATEAWQWYVEPLDSFTPAFFGRAHLPAALRENQPVALVFFFRPAKYPATYHLRHAQVVEFERSATAGNR